MNEVTRIHLGREPFTVSVDAHHALKAYLADIKKHVHDADVVNEVEVRMSELLLERGINSDKVVLPEDVDYLKEQLGQPEDFGDQAEDDEPAKTTEPGAKRLFRDTDNAILGGVAAGLANYFGLDVVLVRIAILLFAVLTSGTGVLVYLLLWLVVPPAVTTSEKLQMRGQQVTLEALKESVSKADVQGAARRINSGALSFIDKLFRVVAKLLGISFVLSGLGLIFASVVVVGYMSLHNGQLFQENIFPVGGREQWLVVSMLSLVVIAAVFLILAGLSVFRRAWPVRGWVSGLLIGLFLVGAAASAALGADAAPHINQRYQAIHHTTAITGVTPFSKIENNSDVDVAFISSPDYGANVSYVENPDLSKLKVYVKGDTLHIEDTGLFTTNHCTMLCMFPRYNMVVTIYAPNIENIVTSGNSEIFYPKMAPMPALR